MKAPLMQSREMLIGRAGEHLVMFDLLSRGHKCFLTDQGVNYDVVLDVGSRLLRLQVKTTQAPMRMTKEYASLVYLFHPRRAGKKGKREYAVGEFDGFALVALDARTVHYYAFTETIRRTLIFRDRRQTYKQTGPHVCPFIDEFTLDAFLLAWGIS